MSNFTESVVEVATLGWLESLGYTVLHGPDIAAAARTPVPTRSELKADIDALANWVAEIRKRRKNGGTLT